MPNEIPQLIKQPWTVAPFQSTNFHICLNQWRSEPTRVLYEGDNNAVDKYLSVPMPSVGQNPTISTFWECWFKLPTAVTLWFNVVNQQNVQFGSASVRGYGVQIRGASNIIQMRRIDGGGATGLLSSYGWTYDSNFHRVRMSREVSGANRFWRVYLDDMTTPIIAAINDATYTSFSWWGWDHSTNARIICGGEACQS